MASKFFSVGTRAAETREWSFDVRVESGQQDATAFTLGYLDYAGQHAENLLSPGTDDPPDEGFYRALARADVLMGLIDGAALRRLMDRGYDADTVGSIERLLNILIRSGRRNIHLVLSKWDLMRRPDGTLHPLSDVISRLDEVSDVFRNFRQNPWLINLRIIPVSALGLNGFVQPSEDSGDVIVILAVIVLAWVVRVVTAGPAAATAGQTMGKLCDALRSGRPAAGYALTTASYQKQVPESHFAGELLSAPDAAGAPCTYQMQKISGSGTAQASMTITRAGRPPRRGSSAWTRRWDRAGRSPPSAAPRPHGPAAHASPG